MRTRAPVRLGQLWLPVVLWLAFCTALGFAGGVRQLHEYEPSPAAADLLAEYERTVNAAFMSELADPNRASDIDEMLQWRERFEEVREDRAPPPRPMPRGVERRSTSSSRDPAPSPALVRLWAPYRLPVVLCSDRPDCSRVAGRECPRSPARRGRGVRCRDRGPGCASPAWHRVPRRLHQGREPAPSAVPRPLDSSG